jgi:hypothetical protein
MTAFCPLMAALALAGCEAPTQPTAPSQTVTNRSKTADLLKEQESVKYELSLRRQELAGMEATSKRPGVVGVSSEWLRRHNDLKEKIVKLQVRLHEIEYELSKKPGD